MRRVPGLRREEVAMLAGISADYYLRLERGRDRNPSAQVLESLARVLQLDDDHVAYLLSLVGDQPRRPRRRARKEVVPAGDAETGRDPGTAGVRRGPLLRHPGRQFVGDRAFFAVPGGGGTSFGTCSWSRPIRRSIRTGGTPRTDPATTERVRAASDVRQTHPFSANPPAPRVCRKKWVGAVTIWRSA